MEVEVNKADGPAEPPRRSRVARAVQASQHLVMTLIRFTHSLGDFIAALLAIIAFIVLFGNWLQSTHLLPVFLDWLQHTHLLP